METVKKAVRKAFTSTFKSKLGQTQQFVPQSLQVLSPVAHYWAYDINKPDGYTIGDSDRLRNVSGDENYNLIPVNGPIFRKNILKEMPAIELPTSKSAYFYNPVADINLVQVLYNFMHQGPHSFIVVFSSSQNVGVNQTIMSTNGDTNLQGGFNLKIRTAENVLRHYVSGGSSGVTAQFFWIDQITYTLFYRLLVVFDGTNFTYDLHPGPRKVNSLDNPLTTKDQDSWFVLGGNNVVAALDDETFKGFLLEAALFDRALTAEEQATANSITLYNYGV